MATTSYRVEVSKTEPPLFPEWCPICAAGQPDHQMLLLTIAWDSTAKNLRSLWPFCWIRLPGCADCAARLFWSDCRRRLGYIVCLASAMWFLNDMFGWENLRGESMFLLFVGTLAVIPAVLYELRHPRPVTLWILEDGLLFSFVNRDYAEEFAGLNRASVGAFDWNGPIEDEG